MKNRKLILPLSIGFVIMMDRLFLPVGSWLSALFTLLMPIPFLYAVRHAETDKQLRAAAAVFCCGFIVMNLGYGPTVLIDIGVFLLSGIYIFLAFLADRRYGVAAHGFAGTLVFPTAWLTLLNLSMQLRFGFQYRLDAYATVSPVFNQALSVIGSGGALFLLLWTSSVLTYLFESVKEKRYVLSRSGLTVWIAVIAAAAVFGSFRLKTEKPAERSVRVAMGMSPYVGDYADADTLSYDEYAALIEACAKKAADGGAEVLMFHEETFYLDGNPAETAFKELSSSLARQYGLYILSAEEVWNTDECVRGKGINRLRWIGPNGDELARYVKHSMVPLVESSSYVAGSGNIPVFELPFRCGPVKVASIICYDSNFSVYIEKIPADTELLFIPSWDWKEVTGYHREVARELAIENGVTIVKNTYDGISIVADPLGRTVLEYSTDDVGFGGVSFADVPVNGRNTVYSSIYYWGVQVFTFVAIGAVIILEIIRRKNGKELNG